MCLFFNVSESSQLVLPEPQQEAAMVAENSEVMIKRLKKVKTKTGQGLALKQLSCDGLF